MKIKVKNANLTLMREACPNSDASLKLGTRVEFQPKMRISHFIKSGLRITFCAKRNSRTTPQNASLGSLAFQLKRGLSSIAFQLQPEHVSCTFQYRCEPVSSASNFKMKSVSSARLAFCYN